MPDLTLAGSTAIVTARQARSLKIPGPRGSADSWREVVVELLRETWTREGVRLVDVEVVLGLGRGMSAWFPVIVALRQALYNLHLVTETVGWVKPGWVERVRSFPHGAAGRWAVAPPASTR